jgi:protein-histidine N-methyltransferase
MYVYTLTNQSQLSILPSQIFYNRLAISGTPITLGRREVIDIRTQLMAEDTADHENEELIAGLEEGDLKPNFYEGGFKTWECSLDLAKLVASENSIIESLGNSQTSSHIIEVRWILLIPIKLIPIYILNSDT